MYKRIVVGVARVETVGASSSNEVYDSPWPKQKRGSMARASYQRYPTNTPSS